MDDHGETVIERELVVGEADFGDQFGQRRGFELHRRGRGSGIGRGAGERFAGGARTGGDAQRDEAGR